MKKYILILSSFALIFSSCYNSEKKLAINASDEMQIDTTEGSCPFISQNTTGNLVLSWIKKTDPLHNIFAYAVSKDGGQSFSPVINIPGSENVHPHGENMPKIIFKPSGEIIAVWGAAHPNAANAYSGAVFYSMSFDNGSTWSSARNLVTDPKGFDQRYFDVAILPNGEAGIVWLDNRKKTRHDGSALYFAETKGTSGFENERLVSEPCCECCRTDLFVDSKKNIHIVYRAIINDSIRDMVHVVSNDEGKTFSTPSRISADNWVINGCPHTGPAMTENKNGLQLTWFTGGKTPGIYYCSFSDNNFSARQMVSGSLAKHCQITTLPDGRILIVWNENSFKDHTSSSRIGLQMRHNKGGDTQQQFISDDNATATFPVIKPVDNNTAFVGYTKTENGRDYVRYKLIKLSE